MSETERSPDRARLQEAERAILAAAEALRDGDPNEAYHRLYGYADPTYTETGDPFAKLRVTEMGTVAPDVGTVRAALPEPASPPSELERARDYFRALKRDPWKAWDGWKADSRTLALVCDLLTGYLHRETGNEILEWSRARHGDD